MDTYTQYMYMYVHCKYSHIGSRGQRAGVVRPWGWDLCAEVHVYTCI